MRLQLSGRDRLTTIGAGLGFVVAAVVLRLSLTAGSLPSTREAVLLVVSYAALSRVEFELGSGTVLPTELVLVPMLFVLPAGDVPLFVAASFLLGGLPDILRRRLHAERVFVRLSYSWHAIGPALVFGLLSPGPPAWRDWPVYTLALASQFAFDFLSSMGREWLGVGVSPAVLAPVLARAYLADLLLAPIGFLAALATTGAPLGFVAVIPLAVLLALLATDRRERISETIDLTDAFENVSTVARVDPLSGLTNRLGWEEAVAALAADTAASRPVSVILLDLDRLKEANDTRGHGFGDQLIRLAAETIERSVGDRGLAARIGGDEFAVLLADTDETDCRVVLARIEKAAAHAAPLDGFVLSFSLGAATAPPAQRLEEAIDLADRRMYERKRQAHLGYRVVGQPSRA